MEFNNNRQGRLKAVTTLPPHHATIFSVCIENIYTENRCQCVVCRVFSMQTEIGSTLKNAVSQTVAWRRTVCLAPKDKKRKILQISTKKIPRINSKKITGM